MNRSNKLFSNNLQCYKLSTISGSFSDQGERSPIMVYIEYWIFSYWSTAYTFETTADQRNSNKDGKHFFKNYNIV